LGRINQPPVKNKGGRPIGSKTQPKRQLVQLLEEYFPGYNAVVSMAKLANDEGASRAERFNANKEVAKYMHPQLKAVDITSAGEGITFNFSIGQQPAAIDDNVIDADDT